MISDVLFDAVGEIERYQRDFPDCYREYESEITTVKATMNALRSRLDACPIFGAEVEHD